MWLTEQRVAECTVYAARLSRLPSGLSFDALERRLPGTEVARVARLHRLEDRQRSLAGLYLFEHAVRDAGQEWQWERFARTATGRPLLPQTGTDHPYDCNISHSGDFVVCAIGPCPLGIDIEQIREVEITEFRRVMPPDLYQRIRAAKVPVNEFFLWWTRIESVLKGDGCGLIDALTELRFQANEIQLANHRWRCYDIDVAPGYACSLAKVC